MFERASKSGNWVLEYLQTSPFSSILDLYSGEVRLELREYVLLGTVFYTAYGRKPVINKYFTVQPRALTGVLVQPYSLPLGSGSWLTVRLFEYRDLQPEANIDKFEPEAPAAGKTIYRNLVYRLTVGGCAIRASLVAVQPNGNDPTHGWNSEKPPTVGLHSDKIKDNKTLREKPPTAGLPSAVAAVGSMAELIVDGRSPRDMIFTGQQLATKTTHG
ncbi:hypothetical protein C8F04DRAFT_1183647 [Mycena alexandri]|uniref:Uncharacterized protein n=1 Tax=Mycena alexandri TaxID=1745969 RepID=A0AAD6SUE8_9AGAR|nr:hypothetical protein C8F04DRAFT_1183647 [Mycena alexandri]